MPILPRVVVASEIGPITRRKAVKALTIDIPMEKDDEEWLMAIRELVRQFPGMQPLYPRFRTIDGRELRLKADAEYSVGDEEAFKEKLAELLA